MIHDVELPKETHTRPRAVRARRPGRSILAESLLGPVVLFALLLVAIAAAATAFSRMRGSEDLVRLTYGNLARASDIARTILDLETGVRGYALSADEAFLAPYTQARLDLPRLFAQLRRSVAERPTQADRVRRIETLVAEWDSTVARQQIELTRAGSDVRRFVRSGEGKRRTDAIRAELKRFEQAERHLLESRLRADEAVRRAAGWAFAVSIVAGLAAFFLAFRVARGVAGPISAMAAAADRIAAGDFWVRLVPSGARELARTSAAFNSMVWSLREARERDEAQNRALEDQAVAAERARSEARAVLDASVEAMVLISADGRFSTVNRCFEAIFGMDASRVLGRSLEALRSDLEAVLGPETVARIAAAAGEREGEFDSLVRQDAPAPRELALHSTPVTAADGTFLGRLYAFRDVTREREVDRMKSEFVSLVSHELRTPLTSIKGYVDLLLDGEVGELEEEQQEFLQIVKNNADRLVTLINDLLDISRIESGRIELRRKPIDLRKLVQGAAATLRPQIEARRQTLTLRFGESLPLALGDPDRVTQILTNLLSNAHKYTPAGGQLAMRVHAGRDDTVQVEVRDSGIGLSIDEQEQLFTKFFRAKNRATQEAGGTGLGLAITRSLVELQGGRISVSSTPGQGSAFCFTLPATREAPVSEPERGPAFIGARVLVVDDEPAIAGLIRRYLERAGHEVLVAGNAGEALRLAQSERPDLITLDVALPDADGFTVLEWLKTERMTRDIPVLMLSILPDTGEGLRVGAVDYMTKPVHEGHLLARVSSLLAGGRDGVLVFDDEPDVRRLLVELLQRAGYRTLEAADGAQALELARQERPGLVLMDVRMPVLDGIEALRAMRADETLREMPVVMMTASPAVLEEQASAIEALGGSALLRKPTTAEELASALARALGRGALR
jgi:PAS domain S-box-containing protein